MGAADIEVASRRQRSIGHSRGVRRLLAAALGLCLLAAIGCGGDTADTSAESSPGTGNGETARSDVIANVQRSLVAVTGLPSGEERDPDEGGAHLHGSGIVWKADEGLILTSNHFVENVGSLRIDVNGREVQGRPVARAQCNDLALVRLRPIPGDLQPIRFADSDRLRTGDQVIAVGYLRPPGSPAPELIATDGNVSAVDVQDTVHPLLPPLPSLILHQAPLRSAMSGGALVNEKGELVGVPTLVDTGQGGPTTQAPFKAVTSNHVEELLGELRPGKGAVFDGWKDQHVCHGAMARLTTGQYVEHGGAHPG